MKLKSATLTFVCVVVAVACTGASPAAAPTAAVPTSISPSPTTTSSAISDAEIYAVIEPALPVIRLRSGAGSHPGDRGSYCWTAPLDEGKPPEESVSAAMCADYAFREGPDPPIEVASGESLTVEILADEKPNTLSANFMTGPRSSARPSVDLEPLLEARLPIDLAPGTYTVHVFGRWEAGDIGYAFKIRVN